MMGEERDGPQETTALEIPPVRKRVNRDGHEMSRGERRRLVRRPGLYASHPTAMTRHQAAEEPLVTRTQKS